MKFLSPLLLLLATSLHAATLPGFRVETIAGVPGFVSSVVADSKGTIYCTTTDGWIFRIEEGTAVPVASLPTHAGGNAGLLGMALLDDDTAAVHYTAWFGERVLDDVISRVDLASGAETVLRSFACDIEVRERGASDEHHGGNPIVAPDGSIFVGIGEYNDLFLAQEEAWNGGKIFRLYPSGYVEQYARGMRNPYDMAWDPDLGRLVVADNGPSGGDELHIIGAGSNCGWPRTVGNDPPLEGAVPPDYVFPNTVAPTGLHRLARDANGMLARGYLLAAFVTSSIYYFPDLAAKPIADPVPVVADFEQFVIDVTQTPDGTIYFASATFAGTSRIHRLHVPPRGDCNGDGLTNGSDILSLMHELDDGNPHAALQAQDGSHAGSWGCDVNADGMIDSADLQTLTRQLSRKRRAVRVR
ncbi:MAG TPA: PQQ-dependent sugar dehydrogenase [Thermoanaerobaculia bacterium]|nr:PQQ-dependent sugar dehydrogenase [Thermoanaerobaculia bacterium]